MTPDQRSRLLTIGYEGYSQGEFLRALRQRNVTILCDVRRMAISRKRGFSRAGLAEAAAKAGLRYEHLWQLGIPSEHRRGARSASARSLLLDDYRVRMLPTCGHHVEQIKEWLVHGETVALVCFERDAQECHRSCVAERLERDFGDGFRAMNV